MGSTGPPIQSEGNALACILTGRLQMSAVTSPVVRGTIREKAQTAEASKIRPPHQRVFSNTMIESPRRESS